MNKSASHRSSFALLGVSAADAIKHFDGKAMGQLQVLRPVTPCLYANSDVHTIPAVFSEICRCYFPEVSVMVTPATAINLS